MSLEQQEDTEDTVENKLDDIAVAILLMSSDMAQLVGYLRGLGLGDDDADTKAQALVNLLTSAHRDLNEAVGLLLEGSISSD